RVSLYLLESLLYYDFLFATSNARTQWWWLISDPGQPDALPAKAIGPFATEATVPPPDFLSRNGLKHVGTWQIRGRSCDVFSGGRHADGGTWCWFDAKSGALARIMNIQPANDFQIPIIGAYYLVDLPAPTRPSASNLQDVHKLCVQAVPLAAPSLPIITLPEILAAMASPPTRRQTHCTLNQIQSLFPGISPSTGQEFPPSWSHQVSSECVQTAKEIDDPYYCQLWYDWERGVQVTVFVQKDDTGAYSRRFDQMLLKGAAGPAIVHSWNGSQWTPSCCVPKG